MVRDADVADVLRRVDGLRRPDAVLRRADVVSKKADVVEDVVARKDVVARSLAKDTDTEGKK